MKLSCHGVVFQNECVYLFCLFCSLFSFETIPQVTLQALLFFGVIKVGTLTEITDYDLILSISSAFINAVIQLSRLKLESGAVKETFVQYSLNCITARFGWIPFKHTIEQFVDIINDADTFDTGLFVKDEENEETS